MSQTLSADDLLTIDWLLTSSDLRLTESLTFGPTGLTRMPVWLSCPSQEGQHNTDNHHSNGVEKPDPGIQYSVGALESLAVIVRSKGMCSLSFSPWRLELIDCSRTSIYARHTLHKSLLAHCRPIWPYDPMAPNPHSICYRSCLHRVVYLLSGPSELSPFI